MAAVQHGKAHNVGLIVHHIIQSEQREVLETEVGDEGKTDKKVTSFYFVQYVYNLFEKKQEL